MLKSFFTLAIRNLFKRKLYSFINIFGLAIGMAVCLVILKYVDFELSYDRHHANVDKIFRVVTAAYQNGEHGGDYVVSAYALGPALESDIPEVKISLRTHPMYGGAVATYHREGLDPLVFREDKMQYADSTFFDVFTHKALQGNLATALNDPNSVVITQRTADKYFGKDVDPIGKTLVISGGWSPADYSVSAVIENVPENSTFTFDFLFPIHNLLQGQQYQQDKTGWGWNNFITYVMLHDHASVDAVNAKIPAFVEKHRGKEMAESNRKTVFNFQPLKDVHLTTGLSLDSSPTASRGTIYFFVIISIFILTIAWINYINLSTARAMERSREVGIKKAIGAYKSQLVWQFLSESVLVNFVAVLLAVILALFLLPVLNGIVGKQLAFDFTDSRLWLVLAALFTFGSAVSGSYPAFVLSSFNTIQVLKGKIERMSGGFSLRKVLVVFQFASSLILITGTFTIYRQMSYMQGQEKGLTMDQMLIVDGPKVMDWENWKASRAKLITFKDELAKIPGVESVTSSGAIPGGGYNWGASLRKDGTAESEAKNGSVVWVDPDFVPTYDIQIVAGKNFDIAVRSDMEAVLVNESALKAYGLGTPDEALNERLILGGDTVRIIGVLRNYHWNSLKTDHSPWIFKADTISVSKFSVHLASNNFSKAITDIEKLYKDIFPGNPFDHYFLDEFFNNQYQYEKQFAQIFGLFAGLAIIIACLGLWGLASFTTALKLKEIGIRKVLGASTRSVMSLLSWQFLKLMIIASVISIPLTWYGISEWLGTFAFRIGLGVDLFIVPVVLLFVIAIGTISLQIFKGASSNPAAVLRTE